MIPKITSVAGRHLGVMARDNIANTTDRYRAFCHYRLLCLKEYYLFWLEKNDLLSVDKRLSLESQRLWVKGTITQQYYFVVT